MKILEYLREMYHFVVVGAATAGILAYIVASYN